MIDEKTVTPVVAPTATISQAIPAMVDATMAVVPAATAAPVLSQAPVMTATDVKPAVDKPASVVAPTVVAQK